MPTAGELSRGISQRRFKENFSFSEHAAELPEPSNFIFLGKFSLLDGEEFLFIRYFPSWNFEAHNEQESEKKLSEMCVVENVTKLARLCNWHEIELFSFTKKRKLTSSRIHFAGSRDNFSLHHRQLELLLYASTLGTRCSASAVHRIS